MKRATAAIALLLLAACSSSRNTDDVPSMVPPAQPAASGSPSVESQIAGLQTSMTELLDRIDVLNERISRLESGAVQPTPAVQPSRPAPHPPASAPAPVQPVQAQPKAAPLQSADIAENYRRALMLIGQAKFAEARAAFQQVFDQDPTGHLADNALFWMGETFFQTGDFQSAMRLYERVVRDFPEENKAPDAMLKLGLAYVKTGDLGMAQRTLQDVIQKYPYSSSAASAKLELQRIKY